MLFMVETMPVPPQQGESHEATSDPEELIRQLQEAAFADGSPEALDDLYRRVDEIRRAEPNKGGGVTVLPRQRAPRAHAFTGAARRVTGTTGRYFRDGSGGPHRDQFPFA